MRGAAFVFPLFGTNPDLPEPLRLTFPNDPVKASVAGRRRGDDDVEQHTDAGAGPDRRP